MARLDIDGLCSKLATCNSWRVFDEIVSGLLADLGGASAEHASAEVGPLFQAVVDVFCRLAEQGNGVSEQAVGLPELFAEYRWGGGNLSGLKNVRSKMLSNWRPSHNRPGQNQVHLLLLLEIEGMVKGRNQALVSFIGKLRSTDVRAWEFSQPKQIGGMLLRTGWFDAVDRDVVGCLRRAAKKKADSSLGEIGFRIQLMALLGFERTAPRPWLDLLYDTLGLPAIHGAFNGGQLDFALMIETMLYSNYVKASETEQHFKDCFEAWLPQARLAGARVKESLPALSWPTTESPTVGFVLASADRLGHTEALQTCLSALTRLPQPTIRPILYVLSGVSDSLEKELTEAGVAVIFLDRTCPNPSYYQRFLWLRRRCQQDAVTAAVFVSTVVFMGFAFTMGLAPVQIWWSMKYHGLEFPEIDGYMALGSFQSEKKFGERVWRICHRALGPLYESGLIEQAREIRTTLGAAEGGLLVGCLGREEKINSRAYIEALAKILDRVPDAIYLWSGKAEDANVVALMEEVGIRQRCRFIGWVNTRLYAQVLDVFLDSFPFASGLTAFEAMAAKCPVVAMITHEAMETGWPTHVWPVSQGEVGSEEDKKRVAEIFTGRSGETLLPCVVTAEDYVDMAVRLMTDKALRSACGEAASQFVEIFMHDDLRMARTTSEHISRIIAEKAGSI